MICSICKAQLSQDEIIVTRDWELEPDCHPGNGVALNDDGSEISDEDTWKIVDAKAKDDMEYAESCRVEDTIDELEDMD